MKAALLEDQVPPLFVPFLSEPRSMATGLPPGIVFRYHVRFKE
jgi:hypothetical protein